MSWQACIRKTKSRQFVFSQFFLVWMPSPQDGNWSKEEKMSESLRDNDEIHHCHEEFRLRRHSLWLHCAIEASFLLGQLVICNQPCQYCCLLVPNALLKCGGQLGSTKHSGWTAMDTSVHRGWLVFEQRVQCGSAFVCYTSWSSFALWGSFWPNCEHWTVSFMYQIGTSFCSAHLRLLHCKMRDMFCCGVIVRFYMGWQKLIEVVIGLTDGFVHARPVVLTFASLKWQDRKRKIEGTSGE